MFSLFLYLFSLNNLVYNHVIILLRLLIVWLTVAATPPPSPQSWACGTLKGLEQSMIPQLVRYARETDSSIANARQENRRRLFAVCPYLPVSTNNNFIMTNNVSGVLNPVCMLLLQVINAGSTPNADTSIDPYKEQFGLRFLVSCESVTFKLQNPVAGDDAVSQVGTICVNDGI